MGTVVKASFGGKGSSVSPVLVNREYLQALVDRIKTLTAQIQDARDLVREPVPYVEMTFDSLDKHPIFVREAEYMRLKALEAAIIAIADDLGGTS